MGYAGTPAKIVAQNRGLQKSIRSKYYQRLEITLAGESTEASLNLSKLSKARADYTRINKLIKKALFALALFIPFAYYACKWISLYLN